MPNSEAEQATDLRRWGIGKGEGGFVKSPPPYLYFLSPISFVQAKEIGPAEHSAVRCGKQLPTAGCGQPALQILSILHSATGFPEIATSFTPFTPRNDKVCEHALRGCRMLGRCRCCDSLLSMVQ